VLRVRARPLRLTNVLRRLLLAKGLAAVRGLRLVLPLRRRLFHVHACHVKLLRHEFLARLVYAHVPCFMACSLLRILLFFKFFQLFGTLKP